MLCITLTNKDDLPFRSSQVDIPDVFTPAFRSFVEEMSNELGERLAGIHRYEKEDALTRAVAAVGPFRAALNAVVPKGDPDYE